MATRIFRVTDMHCSSCAMRLEGLEDEVPGIRRVSARYANGTMEVDYAEDLLTVAQIIEAVRRKGYTAVPA